MNQLISEDICNLISVKCFNIYAPNSRCAIDDNIEPEILQM